MARSPAFSGLGRLFSAPPEPAAAPWPDLREENARLAAALAVETRRAEAGLEALAAVRDRLEALEVELYVARSDQQRAAALADELRLKLSRIGPA